MPKVSIPTARINVHKKHKEDKDGYLFLVVRIGGKKLKYGTGKKIEVKYWNNDRQRATFNKKYGQQYVDLNAYLSDLTTFTDATLRDFPEITADQLRNELDYHTGKKDRPRKDGKQHLSLFEFIELFIDENKGKMTKATHQTFVTMSNHLEGYAADREKEINWQDVSWEFREDFIQWLYTKHNHGQNTAGKVLSRITRVLNEATKRGYNQNQIYRQQGFGLKRVKTKNKIRLTFSEIEQLIKHDFSHKPSFDRVRDLFVLGCFTGLRFSDWHKVTRDSIVSHGGFKFFEVRTQKTGAVVLIPLQAELVTVLEKYDYSLPRISSQKFNDYIKEVCREAGIDSTFTCIWSEGGKTKSERIPKWKKATSHAARRSFASNFYKLGVPVAQLMSITGHSNQKVFFDYIDVSKEEHAVKLAKEITRLRSPLTVVGKKTA